MGGRGRESGEQSVMTGLMGQTDSVSADKNSLLD